MSDPTRTQPVVTGYPASSAHYYNQNHYYANYNSNSTPDSNSTTFLRRIFIIIIATIILFITVTLIAYLILKPQLPFFQITSSTFSNFTITNSSLVSFTSQIMLKTRNPNKKMILVYDHVQAGLFYKWYTLSETNVGPFEQGKEGESELVVGFASAGRFVDKVVVNGIEKEMMSVGVVEFEFRLVSYIGFQANAWRTRRYVRVFCPLLVEFTENSGEGRLRSGSGQCRVVI